MKQVIRLISLVGVLAILLALSCTVLAIDFDVEAAYASVFVVYSGNSLGSGFAVGENIVVTNAHVISDTRDISITTYDNRQFRAYAVGIDEAQDIAVLYIPDASFPVLPVCDPDQIKVADDVYAIGAPKSMAYTLTKGIISALERPIGQYTYIQSDVALNEGNSGGPLLNAAGEVVGVNTMKLNDSEGISLAIPMSSVCSYIQSLGIELDEGGNVAESYVPSEQGNAPVPTPVPTESAPERNSRSTEKNKDSSLLLILCAVSLISIVLNIVLGIALLAARKKRDEVPVPMDPRERTDFEIDLL